MQSGFEKSCEYCGAAYRIYEYLSDSKNKDKITCQICGSMLIGWNGSVVYSAEMISRPQRQSAVATKTY